MTRKDDNTIIKILIRVALHQNKEMTAKELVEWINKDDYKILHKPTIHSIHRIINQNKHKGGYLNDVETGKKDKSKSYYIRGD